MIMLIGHRTAWPPKHSPFLDANKMYEWIQRIIIC